MRSQNLTSWPVERVIQKLRPSLHAPCGLPEAEVEKEPMGVKSAAFQTETAVLLPFVTRTLWPSNAACSGPFKPLPVRVARTRPLDARTTEELGRAGAGDPEVRAVEGRRGRQRS